MPYYEIDGYMRMTDKPSQHKPRRVIARIQAFNIAQLHRRNPFVVAVWSALFPGFGHVLLSQYMKGFILFLWEIFINLKANVNLAILYSLLGKFDLVRDSVNLRWSLLYIPTYIFAVWDSYRSASELNKQYILAGRENAGFGAFSMNTISVNYLDKRAPFVSAAWCSAAPGLSHIALQRLLHAVFLAFWWSVVVYRSNILTAVHLTLFGAFSEATSAVSPQWLLDIPSLLFFCIYAGYVNTVETNKLFDREQAQFLKQNYQSPEFRLPESRKEGADLYVISVFKQAVEVELALSALREEGVEKKDILAVPIEREPPRRKLFDTMYSYTGDSVLDLPMILAAFAALFGSVYGFILAWGPVVWGVIGGAFGLGLGLIIKLFTYRRKKTAGHENEVVVFVSCCAPRLEQVKKILSDNGALGVSLAGQEQ